MTHPHVAQPSRSACRGRRAQHGAALLMAMMIVALVATLASSMLWQHWRSVQLEASERLREQAEGVLDGALDFARMILREDAREDRRHSRQSDDLNENWAMRLQPARISTFLSADAEQQTDDVPDAFLTGGISDAQARYNLRNLAPAGKLLPDEVKVLQRICQSVGVRTDVADKLGDALQRGIAALIPESAASAASAGAARSPASAVENAPLLPESIDQLAWLGVDAESAAKLAPYITLLPRRTPVNVNTASSVVLGALLGVASADASSADRLVNARKRKPFRNLADAATELGGNVQLNAQQLGVSSEFFEVRAMIRTEQRNIASLWLVNRRANEVTPIYRRRLDSIEAAALAAPPSLQ